MTMRISRRLLAAAALAATALAGTTGCAPDTPAGPPLTGSSSPAFVDMAQRVACKLTSGPFTVKATSGAFFFSTDGSPSVGGTAVAGEPPVTTADVPAGCYFFRMEAAVDGWGVDAPFSYRISW